MEDPELDAMDRRVEELRSRLRIRNLFVGVDSSVTEEPMLQRAMRMRRRISRFGTLALLFVAWWMFTHINDEPTNTGPETSVETTVAVPPAIGPSLENTPANTATSTR